MLGHVYVVYEINNIPKYPLSLSFSNMSHFFHGGKKKEPTQPKQTSTFWAKKFANQQNSSFTSPFFQHGTFFVDQAKRCDGVTARFNYQDPISSSNDLVKQFMYRPNRVGMPKSIRV